MSDSDSDGTPINARRLQPKPRRIIKPILVRANSSLDTESSLSSQSSPRISQDNIDELNPRRSVEDDFFCRAFTFRNSSSVLEEEEEEKHKGMEILETLSYDPPELKAKQAPLLIADSDEESACLRSDVEIKKRCSNIEEFDRELSLTPPPEVIPPAAKRRQTNDKDLLYLKEALITTIEEPLTSTEVLDSELDPELISVAQQAQHRAQIPVENGYAAKVEIIVKTLIDDRVSTGSDSSKHARLYAPIKFILRCNDTFEKLMFLFSKTKNIPLDSLVMTYEGVRVFPRATPMSLGIYASGEIEACTRDHYNHLQTLKTQERHQLDIEEDEDLDNPSDQIYLKSIEQPAPEEAIHIKIRSKDGSTEKMKVKPTTSVKAIIQQYIKLKQLPSGTPVRILFDDEVLDPEDVIQNTEIEDGDMLIASVK